MELILDMFIVCVDDYRTQMFIIKAYLTPKNIFSIYFYLGKTYAIKRTFCVDDFNAHIMLLSV